MTTVLLHFSRRIYRDSVYVLPALVVLFDHCHSLLLAISTCWFCPSHSDSPLSVSETGSTCSQVKCLFINHPRWPPCEHDIVRVFSPPSWASTSAAGFLDEVTSVLYFPIIHVLCLYFLWILSSCVLLRWRCCSEIAFWNAALDWRMPPWALWTDLGGKKSFSAAFPEIRQHHYLVLISSSAGVLVYFCF